MFILTFSSSLSRFFFLSLGGCWFQRCPVCPPALQQLEKPVLVCLYVSTLQGIVPISLLGLLPKPARVTSPRAHRPALRPHWEVAGGGRGAHMSAQGAYQRSAGQSFVSEQPQHAAPLCAPCTDQCAQVTTGSEEAARAPGSPGEVTWSRRGGPVSKMDFR